MSNYIIPKSDNRALNILRDTFNLAGVTILRAAANPYIGRPETQLTYERDAPIGVSSLGTPIYSDLTLLGCTYTDNLTGRTVTLNNDRYRTGGQANTTGNNNDTSGFYINLETVIITVDQPIRVVKTEIQGRDGTVKEYIGKDDMRITINGILTGLNGVNPREETNRLKRWLDAPVSKQIVCWWLENMGISNIVVEDYSFPQVAGGYSYQTFSVNCISDTPVELRISQPIT